MTIKKQVEIDIKELEKYTLSELYNYAKINKFDNRSAFPRFKKALAEFSIFYDQMKLENEKKKAEKLILIREIRNQKLIDSDWKVTSAKEQGSNLSTTFKNWRQALRDIPSTYSSDDEYDALLAKDENGNLTHSVWSES